MVVLVERHPIQGDDKEEIVKTILLGTLCAAIVAASAATTFGQAYPTRIKFTTITTNAGALVKSTLTEKDIVARCASDHSVDPARLRLMLLNGDIDVIDIVSSNITCAVATTTGVNPVTNVTLLAVSGKNTNLVKVAVLTSFRSLGGGLLPADLAGTMVSVYSAVVHTNNQLTGTLKATVQAGSRTNHTIYTGTVTIGGKPFEIPE